MQSRISFLNLFGHLFALNEKDMFAQDIRVKEQEYIMDITDLSYRLLDPLPGCNALNRNTDIS